MNLLNEYVSRRNTINVNEVSLGYTTVYLYKSEELESAQVGYRIDESGNSLIGMGDGNWKEEWIVIAYEDCCGDPIFIDICNVNFPVYTALHGEGDWNAELISSTFDSFINALGYIKEISGGRENPVKLEQSPLTEAEKESVLNRIRYENKDIELFFWENWLGD